MAAILETTFSNTFQPEKKPFNLQIIDYTSLKDTTSKQYGISFISATFCILWGVQCVSVLEILSYEQILLLVELIST